MTALPFDVARCVAVKAFCPHMGQCARFTAPHNPDGWQLQADYSVGLVDRSNGLKCDWFLSNKGGSNELG